ncbi:transposase [Streptomyces sp. NBC_00075]|uniref:transposase n=1 Tax=Streptomyces sp. NBC_00075 TaxID=2975641 RepID=UPI00386E9DA7
MAMGYAPGRLIPLLTVRMAQASNPRGTTAMWMRDRLDGLFTDEDFAGWYPADGRRRLSPARLALVSVLQYAENLTDRQAAKAVRCRLDWKYCLGLELDDPGFDHSVLSEFRARMAEGDRADRLLSRHGGPSCGGEAGQAGRPTAHRIHPRTRRSPQAQPR